MKIGEIKLEKCNKIDIRYEHGGKELVSATKEMWIKLTKYHEDNSNHFKSVFRSITFEKRTKKLMLEELKVYVQIAVDVNINKYIGYIISSYDNTGNGEIESLYIDSDYRGNKIGEIFMTKSIEWLDENNANKIIIGVAAGNEKVYDFYEKFGFYPKVAILERPQN